MTTMTVTLTINYQYLKNKTKDDVIYLLLEILNAKCKAEAKIDRQAAEIERLKAQRNETCKWVLEDNEYGVWDTRCGEAVVFDEETPKANGYKYCHYCGKLIEFETEVDNE